LGKTDMPSTSTRLTADRRNSGVYCCGTIKNNSQRHAPSGEIELAHF